MNNQTNRMATLQLYQSGQTENQAERLKLIICHATEGENNGKGLFRKG